MMISRASLLMLYDSVLGRRLFADRETPEGDFSLVLEQNPYSKKSVIGLMRVASSQDLPGYLQRITHYGKYSALAFKGGRNVLKTVLESARGMIILLTEEVMGTAVPELTSLPQIIEKSHGKDITPFLLGR